MSKLAELRKRLLEQEQKSNLSTYSDNTIYPFWNINDNSTAVVRFLPDGDANNPYFWVERQMIKLTFSGIKGHDETKPVTVKVPCMEMWENEKCPIHDEIRPWFKDGSLEETARKYWKKRSYLFQGLVVDSPLKEENVPENPIRRFIISPQIYNIIKAALMDPDFPEIPTDYDAGTDFRINKTPNGQYPTYTTSNWARRERSLTEDERNIIDNFGLFNLNDFLPKKPNQEELQAIFDMFEASVDGQLYDPEKFEQFYKPSGYNSENSNNDHDDGEASISKSDKPAKTVEDNSTENEDDNTDNNSESTGKNAKDILAAIRNRQAS